MGGAAQVTRTRPLDARPGAELHSCGRCLIARRATGAYSRRHIDLQRVASALCPA
ncbi:putative leader peptide [Kitasatospora sp. NBC_01287]|uniref:putative leader peptide n=1 Tax=Kitasatospora sp. NBC_01287 TaxID=2903573 RepID=UPI00338DDC49